MLDSGISVVDWLGQAHLLGGQAHALGQGVSQWLSAVAEPLRMAVQTNPAGGATNGAASQPNAVTSPIFNLLMSGTFFKQVLNTIMQAAYSHSQNLVPDGMLLLNALLFLMLVWKGINLMLNQAGLAEMIAELVELIIYWGIAMLFLQQYQEMTCYIVNGFSYISDKLSDAGAAGHSYACSNGGVQPTNASDGRYAALFDSIKLLFEAMQNMWSSAETEANQGYWVLALVDAFFKMFICLLYILCGVLFFVTFAASQALIYIAISLGPLFIPMVVWRFARDYFASWIRFMMVAGFYGVLGMLVLTFSEPIIKLTVQSTQNVTQAGSGGSPWLAMAGNNIALLVTGLMICYFMMHVPRWANEILSGTPSFDMPRYPKIVPAARNTVKAVTAGVGGAKSTWNAAGKADRWMASFFRRPDGNVSFQGSGKRNYSANTRAAPLKPSNVAVASGGRAAVKVNAGKGSVRSLTRSGPAGTKWGAGLQSRPVGRSAGSRPAAGGRASNNRYASLSRSVVWRQPASGSPTNAGSGAGGRYATSAGGVYRPRDVDTVAMQQSDAARQGRPLGGTHSPGPTGGGQSPAPFVIRAPGVPPPASMRSPAAASMRSPASAAPPPPPAVIRAPGVPPPPSMRSPAAAARPQRTQASGGRPRPISANAGAKYNYSKAGRGGRSGAKSPQKQGQAPSFRGRYPGGASSPSGKKPGGSGKGNK